MATEKQIVEFEADYMILSANSVLELQKTVKAQLEKSDNEWGLHGNAFVTNDGFWHQAMALIDSDEIESNEAGEQEFEADYKIVTSANILGLQKNVKAILSSENNEWSTCGGPFQFTEIKDGVTTYGFAQAMVLIDFE